MSRKDDLENEAREAVDAAARALVAVEEISKQAIAQQERAECADTAEQPEAWNSAAELLGELAMLATKARGAAERAGQACQRANAEPDTTADSTHGPV